MGTTVDEAESELEGVYGPIKGTTYEYDVTISIYTFDFMEDNQIMIEYDYVRTNDSSGTSGVKGSSRVCFVPDENGKYRYEYSMEYGSSSF